MTDTYTSSAMPDEEGRLFCELTMGAMSACRGEERKQSDRNTERCCRRCRMPEAGDEKVCTQPTRPRTSAGLRLRDFEKKGKQINGQQYIYLKKPATIKRGTQTCIYFIVASTKSSTGMPHHLPMHMLALRSRHTTSRYFLYANHKMDF